ncbi:MAG TPA: hypothetical protein VJ508_12995 [Saprospiraceae bacterium]|nr:hypothetical protein [Saprospiraceae bacterium]
MKYILLITSAVILFMACESKPKVISAESTPTENQSVPSESNAPTAGNALHKVVVQEVLPTTKYSYLRVKENEEEFWIAIPKQDIEKGGTYYYRGGLKKTNFKSTEYDRVFETVYLVSGVSQDPGMGNMSGSNPHQGLSNTVPTGQDSKIGPPPGGITIADLIAHKQKYEGQLVKVQGRVIKINNGIMSRNWVHIQDGSLKDEKVDLTVTTDAFVNIGDVVPFEGKIAINKDFGAGYKYEIIMEEAHVIE